MSLPDELQGGAPPEEEATTMPTLFEDLHQDGGGGMRGRITVYCIAEAIDRKALELRLRERDSTAPQQSFPDVLYGRCESVKVRQCNTALIQHM